MSTLPKINLLVIAALMVAGSHAAHAELNPDDSFGSTDLKPYPSLSFDSWRMRPEFSYSYQPLDCNKAGFSTPAPITRAASSLSYTWHDWSKAMGVPDGSNQYFDDTPGRLSAFNPVQLDLNRLFPGEAKSQTSQLQNYGADQGPVQGTSGGYKNLDEAVRQLFGDKVINDETNTNDILGGAIDENVRAMDRSGFSFGNYNSLNVETPIGGFPGTLSPYVNQQFDLGGTTYSSLMFPDQFTGDVVIRLNDAGITYFSNGCWTVQVPTDPNFRRTGRNGGNSWGAKLDDQWAIKRIGFTDTEDSAWNSVPANAEPVIVAIIDTGLDWHHLDINPETIWRNEREVPANGVDDDQNGYIDDIIGWNFMGKNNRPWDFDGHGTLVAGIIGAAHNDVGIAGINPNARIMVLKGVGNFGTTRPSFIAEAIVYAVDNGAKVINISVGGAHASRMVQAAVDFAHQQGVLVVAAAGNEGIELDDYGPGGGEHVLTVGATHDDNRGTGFANFGDKINIAAPGVDVLSLRARFTDANFRPGPDGAGEYKVGDYYVGDDKRYMRANGTSFSAPIVTGVASLIMAKYPQMTGHEVAQRLMQTASDVDSPGNDKYTGNGMVDARAALSVAADFSVTVAITRVEFVPADAPQFARVFGTIDASEFKRAWMQIGPGENPGAWRYVGPKRKFPIRDGELGTIPISQFSGADLWQVVVNVEHKNGVIKRAVFPITLN